MQYKFFLDDQEITERVALGASLKERFAEELDAGFITISYDEDDQAKNVLGLVEIQELDDSGVIQKTTHMYIAEDEVEPITKYPPYYYRHNLRLIELTHKLDYYIINALTFVQPLIDTRTAGFKTSLYIDWKGTIHDISNDTDDILPYSVSSDQWAADWPTEFPFKTRHTLPVTFEPIGMTTMYHFNTLDSVSDPSQRYLVEATADNHSWQAYVYKIDYDISGDEIETFKQSVDISNNPLTLPETYDSGIYRIQLDFNSEFDTAADTNDNGVYINKKYEFEIKIDPREKYSLYDVIRRIRDVYPLEKRSIHESTRLFDIDHTIDGIPNLKTELQNIEAPQLFLSKLTSREALNIVLKYVNGISRLIQNGKRVLTADFFNKRTTDFIFNYEDIFALSSSQDNTDYLSVNRSFMSNVVSSAGTDNPSVKEMGDDGYKGMRSETFHLLPSTAQLQTHYNIYRLLKITLRAKMNFEYLRGVAGDGYASGFHTEEIDLNITPYVVEKSLWDLANPQLALFGNYGDLNKLYRHYYRNRKDDLAYYKYGDNKIEFGRPVGEYFQRTVIERIVISAIAEKLQYYQFKKDPNYNNSRYVSSSQSGTYDIEKVLETRSGDTIQFGGFAFASGSNFLQELSFNVEYIAIDNSVQDSHKEDVSIIDKYTEGINHTNESIINYERASVGNYGIAQRLGVPTIRYGKIGRDEEIEPVGAINQNREIVVEKERTFYPNHVNATMEVSKDFNRLAKYIGIDRAYRPYEVPQGRQTLERQDIYSEYIEYSAHSTDIIPRANNTFITTGALETMLNTIFRDSLMKSDYIKQALFRTDGFVREYPDLGLTIDPIRRAILLPVTGISGKHVLSFKSSFRSNISADFKIVKNTTSSWLEENFTDTPYGLWSEMVPYGDNEGEFKYLHLTLLTNFEPQLVESSDYFGFTKQYPMVVSAQSATNVYFPNQDNYKMMESGNGVTFDDAFHVDKDRGEIYGFTYQLSFVPRDNQALEDVIIGNTFFNDNFLVNGWKEEPIYVYFHTGDDKYRTFGEDKVHNNGTRAALSLHGSVYEVNGNIAGIKIDSVPAGYDYWAIGTESGKLLLACNDINKKYILFEPRNKRTSINYNW